jgi:hypothetical protein
VIAVRSAVEMNNNIMNHSRTQTYFLTSTSNLLCASSYGSNRSVFIHHSSVAVINYQQRQLVAKQENLDKKWP